MLEVFRAITEWNQRRVTVVLGVLGGIIVGALAAAVPAPGFFRGVIGLVVIVLTMSFGFQAFFLRLLGKYQSATLSLGDAALCAVYVGPTLGSRRLVEFHRRDGELLGVPAPLALAEALLGAARRENVEVVESDDGRTALGKRSARAAALTEAEGLLVHVTEAAVRTSLEDVLRQVRTRDATATREDVGEALARLGVVLLAHRNALKTVALRDKGLLTELSAGCANLRTVLERGAG